MDEVTRMQLELDHNEQILRRIRSTEILTDADRRYARTLEESIKRRRDLINRFDRWLSKRPNRH